MRDIYAEPSGVEADPGTGQTGNRSVAFGMGVRFEQDCDDTDPQKQRWYTAWAANAAGRNPVSTRLFLCFPVGSV